LQFLLLDTFYVNVLAFPVPNQCLIPHKKNLSNTKLHKNQPLHQRQNPQIYQKYYWTKTITKSIQDQQNYKSTHFMFLSYSYQSHHNFQFRCVGTYMSVSSLQQSSARKNRTCTHQSSPRLPTPRIQCTHTAKWTVMDNKR